MKTSWFFGDSSTFGHGLRPGFEYYDKYPELRDKRWTEYISEHFKSIEKNHAVCGISNEDIIFRIITNLNNIKENDIVFIQWTHPARLNIPIDGSKHYINIAHIESEEISSISASSNKLVKEYLTNILLPNIDFMYKQDLYRLLSLKLELEKRNILCIMWSPTLISNTIRNQYNWKSIYEETNGEVNDDYHLGFSSQKKLSDFFISQIQQNNTLVKEFDNFWEDNSNLRWDNNDIINELHNLYEFQTLNKYKDYNESNIFI